MKIFVNSLKIKKIFPNIIYGVTVNFEKVTDKINNIISSGLILNDKIDNKDIEYTSEIIDVLSKISNFTQENKSEILNDLKLQININNYANEEKFHGDDEDIQMDLDSDVIHVYSEKNYIIFGTSLAYNVKNDPLLITQTIKESVSSTITHELSHIFELENRNKYPKYNTKSQLDLLMNYIDNIPNVNKLENSVARMLKAFHNEYYADNFSILLQYNALSENINNNITKLKKFRQKENLITIDQINKNSFLRQQLPGITPHFTYNALTSLEDSFIINNLPPTNMEEMDNVAQKTAREGLMRNILFMLHFNQYQDSIVSLFNLITKEKYTAKELISVIKNEISQDYFILLEKTMSDENFGKESSENTKYKFEKLYHSEDIQKVTSNILLNEKIKKQREKHLSVNILNSQQTNKNC